MVTLYLEISVQILGLGFDKIVSVAVQAGILTYKLSCLRMELYMVWKTVHPSYTYKPIKMYPVTIRLLLIFKTWPGLLHPLTLTPTQCSGFVLLSSWRLNPLAFHDHTGLSAISQKTLPPFEMKFTWFCFIVYTSTFIEIPPLKTLDTFGNCQKKKKKNLPHEVVCV